MQLNTSSFTYVRSSTSTVERAVVLVYMYVEYMLSMMRFSSLRVLLLLRLWVGIVIFNFCYGSALAEGEHFDVNNNNDVFVLNLASDVTTNSNQQISTNAAIDSAFPLLDQTIASSDFDLFFNDEDGFEIPAQSIELDLLANNDHDNVGCDVSSSVDDSSLQLFTKHRRRRRRRGETDTCRSELDQNSSLDDFHRAFDQATTDVMFPSEAENLCPPRIFGLSNTLACATSQTRIVENPGSLASTMFDVDPRTYSTYIHTFMLDYYHTHTHTLSLSLFLSRFLFFRYRGRSFGSNCTR